MAVRIGWAEFDALATPVYVGWCEFDANAAPIDVRVGWCEFDTLSIDLEITPPPPPPPSGGGALAGPGFKRGKHAPFYQRQSRRPSYTIDAPLDTEADDEETIIALLLQVAARELL